MPAPSSKNGNGDEAAREDDVQEYAKECEERNSSQEACQDDGECCVDDSTPGYALNRLLPSRNRSMVSRVVCQASAMSNEDLIDIPTCEIP